TDSVQELLGGVLDSLGETLGVSALLIDDEGKVLKYYSDSGDLTITAVSFGDMHIESHVNERLKNISDVNDNSVISLILPKARHIEKYKCLTLPVSRGNKRTGTFIIYGFGISYSDEDITAVNFALSFIAMLLGSVYDLKDAMDKQSLDVVKSAMGSLSYSELEAVLCIFDELNGGEGLLVASKIAEKSSLTRSVIVNGLRKLESAGLIESRSLGMKGTYIKVINDRLVGEVNKLKN
ncbi:MAG: GTP-sensing pleiotropic transcriptional regulator CodY, partial [Clostridiales bacterium]|nr:GTP-sensing pleiotropic transcriptional regulator CodY [Clostridiales bacterium]